MKQPSGSSLVVNHCTADAQVMSDRPVTLDIVPFELSTSISGSHAATYIVVETSTWTRTSVTVMYYVTWTSAVQ